MWKIRLGCVPAATYWLAWEQRIAFSAGQTESWPTADNLSNSDFADYLNTPIDGEGCLVALVALALGGLLAGVFALIGGPELLLEAAFKVVFAGTMVRRLRHFHVLGNWKVRLLRNTAPPNYRINGAAAYHWAAEGGRNWKYNRSGSNRPKSRRWGCWIGCIGAAT